MRATSKEQKRFEKIEFERVTMESLEREHAEARARCGKRLQISDAEAILLVKLFMTSRRVTMCPPAYVARSQQYQVI